MNLPKILPTLYDCETANKTQIDKVVNETKAINDYLKSQSNHFNNTQENQRKIFSQQIFNLHRIIASKNKNNCKIKIDKIEIEINKADAAEFNACDEFTEMHRRCGNA